MSQRFTERAQRVIFFAQEEAARLGESSVGTEHLLLGLVRESDSVAGRILERLGVPTERLLAGIDRQVTRGQGPPAPEMRLTPRGQQVLDYAEEEARQLNNNFIGTEHLLLGLIREGDGLAARVLVKLGADLERTRVEVYTMQWGYPPGAGALDIGRAARAELPDLTASATAHKADLRAALAAARAAVPPVRHFITIQEVSTPQIEALLAVAQALKLGAARGREPREDTLRSKTLALLFEKPSLRTRVGYEAGMTQLGGHAIYLQPGDAGWGEREPVADVARSLDGCVDGIAARVFRHETLVELARHAHVPVINALSDREHPCEALADFLTLREKRGSVKGLRLAVVGDGNNIAHALMLMGARLGTHVVVACPEGHAPDPATLEAAQALAAESEARVSVVHDAREGVKDADVIYTDAWTGMGQEAEAEDRARRFRPFQVNAELVALAKPDALVMHCLPARRGQEITDEVMDGPQSIIFDQAENRLHAQKAVLATLL